jgi:hypothetical protein
MYRKEYKGSRLNVSADTYEKVSADFNKYLVRYLAHTGKEFDLLGGAGSIYVRKRPVEADNYRINFGHYRKTGKLIEFRNLHSLGYYARFKWNKAKVYLPNKTLYRFRPAENAKEVLSDYIINKNTILKYVSK